MLDYTDRHFRVLMRQISKRSLLYTEMVVAKALYHSNRRDKLLDFDKIEHPLSLQIGGDDPKTLSEASLIAESWGYDEINLNLGCPSQKVQLGNFGACLMAEPDLVARCIEAMTKASSLPVTVKHRVGIDDLDNDYLLVNFVDKLAAAGAQRFTIHARKAWLKGLNPKQNRTIPPLQYERVIDLKKQRPGLIIELNGGLDTPEKCFEALKKCDGVMVGRAAYKHPLRWQNMDEIIFGEPHKLIKPSNILRKMIPYAETHLNNNGRLWDICKHTLQLVEGVAGARSWRNKFGKKAQKRNAGLDVIEEAALQLEDAGL